MCKPILSDLTVIAELPYGSINTVIRHLPVRQPRNDDGFGKMNVYTKSETVSYGNNIHNIK